MVGTLTQLCRRLILADGQVVTQRPADRNDIDFLVNLRRLTMQTYLQQAGMPCSDADHQRRVWYHFDDANILHLNGQRIGLAKYSQQPYGLYVHQLQVMPDYQGMGIATAMITCWQQALLPDQFIKLAVIHGNPAHHLYQRLGFVECQQDAQEIQMQWSLLQHKG